VLGVDAGDGLAVAEAFDLGFEIVDADVRGAESGGRVRGVELRVPLLGGIDEVEALRESSLETT
jgi:hypothetical protein